MCSSCCSGVVVLVAEINFFVAASRIVLGLESRPILGLVVDQVVSQFVGNALLRRAARRAIVCQGVR